MQCNLCAKKHVITNKSLIMKKIILLFTLLLGVNSFSQIVINPTPTPISLVQNTLIGPGLTTSNIVFTGQPAQLGFFDGAGTNLGLDSGVVMSSGNVVDIAGATAPSFNFGGVGDADVLATAQSVTSNPAASSINSTHDAAVLEFDFIPEGDQVFFNFVFASSEYYSYINTAFNDAFGFYITGPNPAGGSYTSENLAIVPGTSEPITISTIYVDASETPPNRNGQYFQPITNGYAFNAGTIPIQIRFNVVCGQLYHFKFAVADCNDGILDTGVFLEGGSFQSIPAVIDFSTVNGDTLTYEACDLGTELLITRPACLNNDSLTAWLDFSGTATYGVDYDSIPDSVLFLPGEDSITINFNPIADGIPEGTEDVIITLTSVNSNGDTLTSTAIGYILDKTLTLNAQDTTVLCRGDSMLVGVVGDDGLPPYTYTWTNGVVGDSIYVPIDSNGVFNYVVEVTDVCGFTAEDTLTVTVNQTLAVDTIYSYPATSCNPTGAVSAQVVGDSSAVGDPDYTWIGPGLDSSNFTNATVWSQISPGWYYFTVTDDVCTVRDSAEVIAENAPVAQMSANPVSGCIPVVATFENQSQNGVSYEWIFGDGTVENTSTTESMTHSFTQTSTVQLVVTDVHNCTDTAIMNIAVNPCGCTDPTALNYNPNAVTDDGSCEYPIPVVSAPNVINPGSGGPNSVFYLTMQSVDKVDLVILNRWGNVIKEETSANPTWDGKGANGQPVGDGVYFYRYKAYGPNPENTTEGHGFIQVVNNTK